MLQSHHNVQSVKIYVTEEGFMHREVYEFASTRKSDGATGRLKRKGEKRYHEYLFQMHPLKLSALSLGLRLNRQFNSLTTYTFMNEASSLTISTSNNKIY